MEVIGFPLAVAVLMNQLFPDKFSLNADQSEVRLSNLRIWCIVTTRRRREGAAGTGAGIRHAEVVSERVGEGWHTLSLPASERHKRVRGI